MTVKTERILDTAGKTLLRRPNATLRTIADAAGISRTTIYNRFATREELIEALAVDTLNLMETRVGVIDWSTHRDPYDVVLDLWTALQPLSARATLFLTGALQQAPDVTAGWEKAFTPWGVYVWELYETGRVRNDLPLRWLIGCLVGLFFSAFDEVDHGQLEVSLAGHVVATSWLSLAGVNRP